MALLRNIAGIESDSIGVLDPGLNVGPENLPRPETMPAHLPGPYIKNGRLLLTPVPPNFEPSAEDVAFILMCLQLWIYKYGPEKINVFKYSTSTEEGYGYNWFVLMVQNFCAGYHNPAVWNGMSYGEKVTKTEPPSKLNMYQGKTYTVWETFDFSFSERKEYLNSHPTMDLYTIAQRGYEAENIDFFNPPPPGATDWIERNAPLVMAIVGKVFSFALAKVFPFLGLVFNAAFAKVQADINSPTDLQEFTAEVQQDTAVIIAADQQRQSEKQKKNLMLLGLLAVAAGWYFWDDIKKVKV